MAEKGAVSLSGRCRLQS
ncbi:hypothetical protein A2U01_0066651, partial [Trifolium medium]|nr:hypothetical protein [Trifolium medium]